MPGRTSEDHFNVDYKRGKIGSESSADALR